MKHSNHKLKLPLLRLIVFVFSFLSSAIVHADFIPGQILNQELNQDTWQQAEGLMPEPVLSRFQDGSYQAEIIALPQAPTWTWSSTFNAASEKNANKFAVDADDVLIDTTTQTYPSFVYGLPFPQIDPDDRQAAVKVLYNFVYTLMQADDADRLSNLYWVSPTDMERNIEFHGQVLFYGSRFSGPIANPEETLRRTLLTGMSPNEVRGAMILEWIHLDPRKPKSLWSYLPEIRKVRRLPAFKGSDSMFGTDLAFDDPFLFYGTVQSFSWRLLGIQDALVPQGLPVPPLQQNNHSYVLKNPPEFLTPGWQGENAKGKAWWPSNYRLTKRPVWVVEATAKDPKYAYARQVLWIDQELFIAYYKETYDRVGRLWRMLLNSIAIWQSEAGDFSFALPDFTLSVDEQRNRATVELPLQQGRQLRVNAGLTEEQFTPVQMRVRGR